MITYGLPIAPPPVRLILFANQRAGLSFETSFYLFVLIYALAALLLLIVLVTKIENLPLASIGWRNLRADDILLGVAAFVLIEIASSLILKGAARSTTTVNSVLKAEEVIALPGIIIKLALNVVTPIAEEVGDRGYAIEHLSNCFGRLSLGALCAYALSLLAHIPLWGLGSFWILAPGELILVCVYCWRRSLWPSLVAHWLTNIYADQLFPALSPTLQNLLMLRGYK